MESFGLNSILEKILDQKRRSIEQAKTNLSLRELMSRAHDLQYPSSFISAVHRPGKLSIIAEMKKESPSAGVLIKDYSPLKISRVYEDGGAHALSILTEENYFKGSTQDILDVKAHSKLPILRKDFIIDPYQIYESKAIGASAILLIIASLNENLYLELMDTARKLDLDVLVEVHSKDEINIALKANPKLIGINNRNLKDLSVSLETTFNLIKYIPKDIPIVCESGIQTPKTIQELKSIGVCAALIGESLLKSKEPLHLLKSFVEAGEK